MVNIKSYDKLFQILDYVKTNPNVKLQTLVEDLCMSKSTLHRIVMELVDYGVLLRDGRSRTYRLGPKLIDYGTAVIESFDIRHECAEAISELNRITLETVHLATFVDQKILYVDKRESPHNIRMYSMIGKEAPFYCTGVGKAIMAFQNIETIESVLKKRPLVAYTEHTIVDAGKLKQEFETIRREKVAFDREEHESGIICIASPIFNHMGEVFASISVTSITQRMSLARLESYKSVLITSTETISKNLGYKVTAEDCGFLNEV